MEPVTIAAHGIMLREWQEDDLEPLARIYEDPEVERFMMFPVPWGAEQQAGYIGRTKTAWENDNPRWAVADASTGALLGGVGVTMMVPGEATIMFFTGPEARERGVATTACREAARFAFDMLRLERLNWEAMIGNHYSKLVALKVGFHMEGIARNGGCQRGVRHDQWRASLLPGELREAGELPENYTAVRSQAEFFASGLPTLKSEVDGLTLRPFNESDLGDAARARSESLLNKQNTLSVEHDANLRSKLLDQVRRKLLLGSGIDFVMADESGGYCGEVSLDISQADTSQAKISFLTSSRSKDQQLSISAVRVLSEFGMKSLQLSRIKWVGVAGDNESRRIVEAAGYEFEGLQRRGLTSKDGGRVDSWVASRTN